MTHIIPPALRLPLLIFLAALLPRLYALDTFLTIDEVKWAEGAAQFLLALRSGDLAQTYWHFFPGITIAWGGALTLWARCLAATDVGQCAQGAVEHLPAAIGWLRLTPVILTSLGVGGVYRLGRKLLPGKIPVVAALLLAFDPFFIAHSRILNGDAVVAILMFLSLLAFLFYWLRVSPSHKFHPSLLFSSVLAGLALLTKLPAPLIGLFIACLGPVVLAFDWPRRGWAAVRQWVGVLAVWGVVALAVFVLLWPALWVAPAATLRQMYLDSFEVGGVGEGHDAFFLGQTLDDPGPWFYPYALAFRLTPVVLLGLLMTLAWLISRLRAKPSGGSAPPARFSRPDLELTVTWVIVAFVIFIIVFANISPKKLDRYVMAVIPALIFLAAIGLEKMGRWSRGADEVARRGQGQGRYSFSTISNFLLAGLVGFQLVSAILAAPYYLTYYNPLLGGPERAAAQVPVGWGEGLELAAGYLNNLPNAESLSVSAWYSDIFAPYSVGQRASFADDGRAQLAADYVVFYINQFQREKPYPGLINYFRTHEPVFVVNIGPTGRPSQEDGARWVEVYQAPAAQSASGAPKIEGVAQLLAYKVTGSRVAPNPVSDDAGNGSKIYEVSVTLFLRVLGPLPVGSSFAATLVPIHNPSPNIHAQKGSPKSDVWQSASLKGEWLEGAVVEWLGMLTLPPATPPGEYRLTVTLQDQDGSTIADVAISEKDPAIILK
ncbi:MAG: glycosyltransferase family 39 protein [Anaerolineales bacterium]|nr:glycosyltransferase family 39 protein [Anaerolineales bacterium]